MSQSTPAPYHDPVRQAFADENDYQRQREVYASGTGDDAREVAFQAIAARRPQHIFEAGCGMGECAERMMRELGAQVTAIDISPRMVELARQRGVAAQVGQVEALNFADATFDCVVANWVLHYLDDPRPALRELARVLRPDGYLVAATNGEAHMGEVWELLFGDPRLDLSFCRENGEALLREHFSHVERIDIDGTVVFSDHSAVQHFIAGHMNGAELAAQLPSFEGSLHATRRASVFIASNRSAE